MQFQYTIQIIPDGIEFLRVYIILVIFEDVEQKELLRADHAYVLFFRKNTVEDDMEIKSCRCDKNEQRVMKNVGFFS